MANPTNPILALLLPLYLSLFLLPTIKISEKYSINISVIFRITSRFYEIGSVVKVDHRGRPRSTNCERNKKQTLKSSTELVRELSLDIRLKLLHRRAGVAGLHGCKPPKKTRKSINHT